jgi:iron complex outermembrane receptor protein
MNLKSVRMLRAGFALASAATLPYFAVAQTAPAPAPAPATETPEPEVKMEKFVVTGSNIPQAADALSIPVAVIDAPVMANSGVAADTLDLLRKVAPNISGIGQENAQINSGSTFGGASVTIKNLATLVLINGRRVANNPVESTGGNQFVDLNAIPPAAIERIEVLQDGASAIYGSDAVGGVINIILKKEYNGWEAGAHYGFSNADGHYAEKSGYLVGGVSTDKTSITVAFDYAQHKELYLSSRPYTNPIYGTYTAPGTLEVYDNASQSDNFYKLAPGVGAPPGGGQYTLQDLLNSGVYVPETADQAFHALNLAAGETLIGALKRYSAMVNMDHKIFGDRLVAFGDMITSNTKTWSSLNAQPLVPFVSDPYTDVNVNVGFTPPPAGTSFIPYTAPTNPFSQAFLDQQGILPDGTVTGEGIYVRNRYLDYPRLYKNDSTLYRLVGGLKGDISEDLHWEAAANINRYSVDFTNPGVWDTNDLQAAWASGKLNQFAVNNPASAFEGVVGTAFANTISTLNSFDVKLDGTPFDLPGGKMGFAAGLSYVREALSCVPDINSLPNSSGTTQGWSNATTFHDFNARRDFLSEFAEVNIPVFGPKQGIPGLHSINVDAAIRHDKYNGRVGSTTVPEINVSWQPVDEQLKLRASAGKSFIAPTLYDLYGPNGAGSTPSITYTTLSGATKNVQFQETTGANRDLKPSTAKSWTAGFVYTPKVVKGLSITVDYSDISQKLIVGNVPAATIIQDVETHGTASPYINDVHYNTPTGATPSAPGGISNHSPQSIYVIQSLVNLSGQKVDSTDITVDYTWKAGSIGKFDFSSVWTLYESYTLQLIPTEKSYNYVGEASTNNNTVPRYRTYTTFNWTNGGIGATIGLTHVASVTDVGVGGDNQSGMEKVASFTAVDLNVSYDFSYLHAVKALEGLKLTVGVNNIANKMPPTAMNAFPDTNADVGAYDGAVGRMYYVEASLKF